MLMALGWWTYSLITYNEKNSHLLKQELQLQSKIEQLKLERSLISNQQNKTLNINNLDKNIKINYHNQNYICGHNFLHKNINNIKENKNVKLTIKEINNILFIEININNEKLKEIETKVENKRFAWYGEGISIALLTLLIIGILGYYLDRIIRFNQQQNNFLLAITHELKTPVASASLAIHSAKKFGSDPQKLNHVLGIAQHNLKRLTNLIEQVVMATKFENNFIVCHREWVSLEKIFENVFADFGENLPENLKKSSLNYKNISLYCDVEMIQIAISNLISNAIKYSLENDVNINVKVQTMGNLSAITVCDNGIGIPVKERNLVLKKFYRSGNEKTRIAKGSGLGLFLVKKIADLHKAKVNIAPNTPRGTCISILFKTEDIRME